MVKDTIVSIAISISVMIIGFLTYAGSTFVTKREFDIIKEQLYRIESKVDMIREGN